MTAALQLARRNLGRVWPNPAVGCVIARACKDGRARIVGRGWTGIGGRPHAEAEALRQAGDEAIGATVFVTLEPCAHHGVTPPCAQALIDAKIGRVVSCLEDPDPRVAGKGFDALCEAGVTVDIGLGRNAAGELNAGFVKRVKTGLPLVTLKLAISSDGMIAAGQGLRTAITGEAANHAVHMMRARADAVLVGAGTWRADDPELTCRLAAMGDWSPVRVVLDARCELPLSSRLIATIEQSPVWVCVGRSAPSERRDALASRGVNLLEIGESDDGRLDLKDVLSAIGGLGITRLMVEGGAELSRALLLEDLVDEAVILIAARTIGPGGVAALGDLNLEVFEDKRRFVLVRSDTLGPDTLREFRRRR